MIIDVYFQRKVQVAYDYLWDRWGLLLGHARGMCAGLFYAIPIMRVPFDDSPPNWFTWVMVGVNLMFIELFAVRPHLQRDTALQRNGKFAVLNAVAMDAIDRYRMLRMLMFVFFALTFSAGHYVWWGLGSSAAFLWVYLLGVQVRDRDSSRFEQRDVSFSGA